MKEWMKKLVGLDKLEKENNALITELAKQDFVIETINGANRQLARQVIDLEKELDAIKDDYEAYIEEQVERRLMAAEEELEDKIKHKYMAIGRYDAFSTYGVTIIRSLEDCRKRGKDPSLWIDENCEYVGTLCLEDVKAVETNIVIDDGIVIDDLTDIGA